ncbi:uncharacterized protein B0I36DRAFT_322297 [Microdochium trichocladiopsis]|uniref:Uncharacterized protein n=1 Tax=Microdochium trichocladiopsis TaxID=1682393 RepID=A0A9P8Y5M0_9PEZI|nr:uncharacterized protein B0I36DRAFT_322297 [Microdochium trichocladiopsis]KAH7030714.1 hypothetical protein B0I36DRAFT_322297 [Microdochium trichocladiopsis]
MHEKSLCILGQIRMLLAAVTKTIGVDVEWLNKTPGRWPSCPSPAAIRQGFAKMVPPLASLIGLLERLERVSMARHGCSAGQFADNE